MDVGEPGIMMGSNLNLGPMHIMMGERIVSSKKPKRREEKPHPPIQFILYSSGAGSSGLKTGKRVADRQIGISQGSPACIDNICLFIFYNRLR